MITIDSKIDLFNKVVLEKIELEYKRQLEEIEVANEMVMAKYQKEASDKAEKFVDKMVKEAELESKRTLAKVKGEVKTRILNTRAHLIDDLVKAVESRARQFVVTDEYGDYVLERFKDTVASLCEYDEIILEMVDKDIERFKNGLMRQAYENGYAGLILFEETQEDIIGGMIVYNGKKTIKYDGSIRSIIHENYGLMGQLVHQMIKEAGDDHE